MAKPGPPKISRELAQQALNLWAQHDGNMVAAAKASEIARTTLNTRVTAAREMGLKPNGAVEDRTSPEWMRTQIKQLEQQLAAEQKKALTHTAIKSAIIQLAGDVAETATPKWATDIHGADSAPGIPTLFVSDLHWGEVVDPKQINGVNRYNLTVAQRRLEFLGERAVRLLRIIDPFFFV